MAQFELKKTQPAKVTLDEVTGVATVNQGFITGVVGVPDSYGMVAGDVIDVQVEDYLNKSVVQTQTEVMAAVAAFIATKYPNT